VTASPALDDLNAQDAGAFAESLGPLFERAPRFLRHLSAARPFHTWDELFTRATTIALAMPERDQLELLDAHPRIGAPPGTVSTLSFREQGYDREQAEAIASLDPLNDEYEQRLGFRYVVFVAGRPRSAIVPLLEAAIQGDRDAELLRALREVVAIAHDRARKLGWLEGS
jgi:2-oxo-4-hydroxy-4-carboxy--5-ureidoimidazoline (OHCU) decarboxylase